MTTANQPTLRELVEDFLFRGAELADDWRLADWAALSTEDACYIVPTTDLPEGDPRRDLVFTDDDVVRLRVRAMRLNYRHIHQEYPWSRTRRFASNLRVQEADNGELSATANVMAYRFRSGEGAPYVGNVHDKLRREAEHFNIAHRPRCWTWKPYPGTVPSA